MAGLYIHIPFCASKCAYCDFYSVPCVRDGFLEALRREMDTSLTTYRLPLTTIYIGGGTPSLFAPRELQGLVDHAAGLWDCADLQEITVEANPEDLTDDYIDRLARTDFNRLSIGIQSFDDAMLKKMNRRHSAQRAREAIVTAQRAGFDNITIDLIYGIPGMSLRSWERTLDEVPGLGVQHISAYHLTIEPGTAFGKTGLRPIPETQSERQYELLCRKLADAGYEHYEISNFALPGRRAVHNSGYWSGEPYLGIGPAAHSYDGDKTRKRVVADVEKYIAQPTCETETLSDTDLANERIMVGLRCLEGVEKLRITNYEIRDKFLRDGLLISRGDRLAIPPEKWLLADYIISRLFE